MPVPGQAGLARITAGIDALLAVEVDGIREEELRELLGDVQVQLDRLEAVRDGLFGAVQSRARRRATRGRQRQAEREARRDMREQLQLTGSEAKRAGELGGALEEYPQIRAAYRAGRLRAEQALVIVRTLRQLDDAARQRVMAALLEAARTTDAVALGRLARRLLAAEDADTARQKARRDRQRRRFTMTQTSHGSVVFNGELYGLAAERLMTAIHGFARPDAPATPPRTSEQRLADAFEEVLIAALERGTAPTDHGVRPQVHVTIPWEVLGGGQGTAEGLFTGPIDLDELRPMLQDVGVCRILLDARSAPIEVSAMVRTVPAGLWRALVQRDRGCRWPGCDAPAGFCDVAHATIAWADGGRLSLDNAVLLCRPHHRRVDGGGWELAIDGSEVRIRRR